MGAQGQWSIAITEENTGSFTFQPSEETRPNEFRFHPADFGCPGNQGITSSSGKETATCTVSVML